MYIYKMGGIIGDNENDEGYKVEGLGNKHSGMWAGLILLPVAIILFCSWQLSAKSGNKTFLGQRAGVIAKLSIFLSGVLILIFLALALSK